MIKAAIAGLALLAVQSDGRADPAEGSLDYNFETMGVRTTFSIQPDGKLVIDRRVPDRKQAWATVEPLHAEINVGFTGYRRIAALFAPMRRHAGGVAPCTASAATMFEGLRQKIAPGAPPQVPLATLRWRIDGAEARADPMCMGGPAINDIELVRAAHDQVAAWVREGEYGPEGPRNDSIETIVPEGEED